MRISSQTDSPTISILVHRDVVPQLYSITASDRLVQALIRNPPEGGVDFFAGTTGKWGFGDSFTLSAETSDGFIPFTFQIPRVKMLKDEKCTHCKGSGKNRAMGGDCLYCFGKGRECYYDRRTIWAISASVSLLTDRIGRLPPEHDTSAKTPQLLSFETFTGENCYGVSGKFSVELARWLRRGERPLHEPTQAMLAAWDKMMGADELDRMNISARVDNPNGWLSVCCPNSGIHPVDHTIRAGHGYEFSFFGMENPFEQLTILAGLGAVNDQAMQELGL